MQAGPAKEKRKVPAIAIILVCFVVLLGIGILIAVLVTGDTSKQDFIKIGKDEIQSVKYILGEERKVSGVSTTTENGITKKVIVYNVLYNQREDMLDYAQTLRDVYGFYFTDNTDETDFSGAEGVDLELVKESVEDDYLIILRIDYDSTGYTITLTRARGTLTVIG